MPPGDPFRPGPNPLPTVSPYIGPAYVPHAEDLPSSPPGPGPGTTPVPPNPTPSPTPIGDDFQPPPAPAPRTFNLNPPGGVTPMQERWGFTDGNFPLGSIPEHRLAQPIKARHDFLYDLFDDLTKFVQSIFVGANAELRKVPIDSGNTRFMGNVEGQRRVLVEIAHQRKLNIYRAQGQALTAFESNVAGTPKADGIEIIKAPMIRPNRPDRFTSVVHADIKRPVRGRRSVATIVPTEIADYVDTFPDGSGSAAVARSRPNNIALDTQTVSGIARNEQARERKETEPKWQNSLFIIAAVIVAVMILRKA